MPTEASAAESGIDSRSKSHDGSHDGSDDSGHERSWKRPHQLSDEEFGELSCLSKESDAALSLRGLAF